MAELNGGLLSINIGTGFSITAPGLVGTAVILPERAPGVRGPERATEAFTTALARTSMAESATIELDVREQPGGAGGVRGPDGAEAFELTTPDFGENNGQVILAIDESGALSWHYPLDDTGHVQPPAVRGAAGQKRYLIRRASPPVPQGATGERGFISAIGKKLLKVFVYPITDPIIGAITSHFAEKWEAKNRPYGLRSMTPADYRNPAGSPIDATAWSHLATGRALLFVHGTFSTAHGAFHDLAPQTMAGLHAAYGERTFAFNHPSLSHDPRRNVEWFLSQIPAGSRLDLDVVCHSRGGLVSRVLAERPSAFGLDNGQVDVRRIVFVGVPNKGTLLAHPDHMAHMLDRFTTALNIAPSGVITEALEAIVTAVKMLAHGALGGLQGLASMQPDGEFLQRLNGVNAGPAEYYAIAADYEPVDPGLKMLVADAVLDRVFKNDTNDLVVPELGVFEKNGAGNFPIAEDRLFRIPRTAGIMHTSMFGYPEVGERLTQWLQS
jgi:hypothetical protein